MRMELRKEFTSYSWTDELIEQELQKVRLDSGFYGMHSLRAGGASAAAALGITDRLFQWQEGRHSPRSPKITTSRSPSSHCLKLLDI